jgi:hypothetical protein
MFASAIEAGSKAISVESIQHLFPFLFFAFRSDTIVGSGMEDFVSILSVSDVRPSVLFASGGDNSKLTGHCRVVL